MDVFDGTLLVPVLVAILLATLAVAVDVVEVVVEALPVAVDCLLVVVEAVALVAVFLVVTSASAGISGAGV